MNKYPGKLIVFYGINNLGKSTQAKLLVERLKANGYQAEYLKYPIYDLAPSGQMLNDYLRNANPYGLHSREAQIMYAMNRTQYQADLIAKLKAGINVIAEDYKGTGIAWGLGAGVDEKFLKEVNSHLISEDLVFLFDGERFRQAIENNHKHENDEDLMTKVRWAHLKLREEYGWWKINANLAIEEIHEEIWVTTRNLLEGSSEILTQPEINKTKETYNYSGFQAIGDIITDNRQTDITVENSSPSASVAIPIKDANQTESKENISTPKENILKMEKMSAQAKLPQRAHLGDAGYDLYASDYYSISPYGQALVSTGIKMAIPEGYAGLIWDKSGVAFGGIKTMGGVIDSSYRGEIMVIIKNLSEEFFNIVPGQKIAQILIQAVADLKISEEAVDDETTRAAGGFGSTGQF